MSLKEEKAFIDAVDRLLNATPWEEDMLDFFLDWSEGQQQRFYDWCKTHCIDCGFQAPCHSPDCRGYYIPGEESVSADCFADRFNIDGWEGEPLSGSADADMDFDASMPWQLIDWSKPL